MGANEATHLFTTRTLTFGNVTLNPGIYTLWMRHTRSSTWLIINRVDPARIEVAHTDAWHFTPIYFYPPLESNFIGEGGAEHIIPATSSP